MQSSERIFNKLIRFICIISTCLFFSAAPWSLLILAPLSFVSPRAFNVRSAYADRQPQNKTMATSSSLGLYSSDWHIEMMVSSSSTLESSRICTVDVNWTKNSVPNCLWPLAVHFPSEMKQIICATASSNSNPRPSLESSSPDVSNQMKVTTMDNAHSEVAWGRLRSLARRLRLLDKSLDKSEFPEKNTAIRYNWHPVLHSSRAMSWEAQSHE